VTALRNLVGAEWQTESTSSNTPFWANDLPVAQPFSERSVSTPPQMPRIQLTDLERGGLPLVRVIRGTAAQIVYVKMTKHRKSKRPAAKNRKTIRPVLNANAAQTVIRTPDDDIREGKYKRFKNVKDMLRALKQPW
jgi:hypothetical protein